MRRWAWVLLVMVVATGCGKSTKTTAPTGGTSASPSASPSPTPSPAVTKADYVTKGNAICMTMNAKLDAIPSPAPGSAGLAATFEQGLIITQDALTQLKALPQPPGDEATLAADFAKVDALVALGQQELAALRAGKTKTAETIDAQLTTATDAANAAFNDYGLTVCGT